MIFSDLLINVNKDNYKEILDALHNYNYKYIGVNLIGDQQLWSDVKNYASNYKITIFKKMILQSNRISILKIKKLINRGTLVSVDCELLPKIDKKIIDITKNIIVTNFSSLIQADMVKSFLKLIKKHDAFIEIPIIDFIKYISSNPKNLFNIIKVISVYYENKRLIISSGATNKHEIFEPKFISLLLAGLINLENISFSPISTNPINYLLKVNVVET